MLSEVFQILKKLTEPLEEELKKAIHEVVVQWLTDLGEARPLQQTDLEELRRRLRDLHKL
ncbi:MAG: hypothetical protein QW680_08545 [Pyrobaculum sp.]